MGHGVCIDINATAQLTVLRDEEWIPNLFIASAKGGSIEDHRIPWLDTRAVIVRTAVLMSAP